MRKAIEYLDVPVTESPSTNEDVVGYAKEILDDLLHK